MEEWEERELLLSKARKLGISGLQWLSTIMLRDAIEDKLREASSSKLDRPASGSRLNRS